MGESMRLRSLLILLGLNLLTLFGTMYVENTRFIWVLVSFFSFLGIWLFDKYKQLSKDWINGSLFLLIYGLLIHSFSQSSVEYFWSDIAGAFIVLGLLYEQNLSPWAGNIWFRSSLLPVIVFFVLVAAQNAPIFVPATILVCSLLALLVLVFYEVFLMKRESLQEISGSLMSATRTALCGMTCLYYCSTFLPSLISVWPFSLMHMILPVGAIILATVSFFTKDLARRYIFFCANWSLFILWAALAAEPFRVFAACGGVIFGSWAVMMSNKRTRHPSNVKDIFLKLSGWGAPGTIVFSFIVFLLIPSEKLILRYGSVIWFFSFLIYWLSLLRLDWAQSEKDSIEWDWRNSLALGLNFASGALFAGIPYYSKVIDSFWGILR